MAIDETWAVSGGNSIAALGAGTAAASKQAVFEQLFEKLKEEAAKTPEERARDDVLKKNGLTEDSYRQLPQSQRAGIDLEIKAAVQRVAEQRRASIEARQQAA